MLLSLCTLSCKSLREDEGQGWVVETRDKGMGSVDRKDAEGEDGGEDGKWKRCASWGSLPLVECQVLLCGDLPLSSVLCSWLLGAQSVLGVSLPWTGISNGLLSPPWLVFFCIYTRLLSTFPLVPFLKYSQIVHFKCYKATLNCHWQMQTAYSSNSSCSQ